MSPIIATPTSEDDLARRTPAQKAVLAGVLSCAFARLQEMGFNAIEDVKPRPDGLSLIDTWTTSDRCGDREHHRVPYLIPWDLLLSDAPIWIWKQQEDARREAEEAAAYKAARAEEARQDALRKEARDRAEYARLQARFGPPAG